MKAIKSILLVMLLGSFSQMNAQKILEKWEELNIVNQIMTKMDYVANEGNFDKLGQYTTALKDYTAKLDLKSVPAELVTSASKDAIKKLNSEAITLNSAVEKKASNEEIITSINNFKETLKNIIESFKME